ncbi:MAG TPA: hypothetical protein VN174_00865 [Candidatus Methanoperedens sp.]|nr:hypothetical protein [Candidatus Methanoperedens sp.]
MEPQDNPVEDKILALDSKEALPLEAPSNPPLEPVKTSSHASPSDLIIIAEPKAPPQEAPITPESPKTDTKEVQETTTPSPTPLETVTTPTPDSNPPTPVEPQLPPIPTTPLVPPIVSPPVAPTPEPSLVSSEVEPQKKSKLIPISIILLILFLAIYAAVTLSEVFTK